MPLFRVECYVRLDRLLLVPTGICSRERTVKDVGFSRLFVVDRDPRGIGPFRLGCSCVFHCSTVYFCSMLGFDLSRTRCTGV